MTNSILAPHSSDAEEAVLGSLLIHPELIFTLITFLCAEDFYILRNAWIWSAIVSLYERGDQIDYLIVVEELRTRNQLDQVGGAAYITKLINDTPTHIHGETYGRYVERASIRRRLLDAATNIGRIALDEQSEIQSAITASEIELAKATRKYRAALRPVPLVELANANYEKTELRYQNGDRGIVGIPTGFSSMDVMLGGLTGGLYICLARSKMGKTSMIMSIVYHVACWLADRHDPRRILVLTNEETPSELTERLEVIASNLEAQKVRMAAFNERDWDKYTGAHARLHRLPVDILDIRGLTDRDIVSITNDYLQENPLALIAVDFLQRVSGVVSTTQKNENRRHLEIKTVAYSLADLGKLNDIPILCGAQAKQEARDKLPSESDIQESDGALQASTAVFSFFRPGFYDATADPTAVTMAIVASRKSITGPVECRWHGSLMWYRDNPPF